MLFSQLLDAHSERAHTQTHTQSWSCLCISFSPSLLLWLFLFALLCSTLYRYGRLVKREADTWSPNEISKTQSEPMKTVNEKINQLILRSLAPHLFTQPNTTKPYASPLSRTRRDGITSLRGVSVFFLFFFFFLSEHHTKNAHNNAIIRVTSTPFSVILIMKLRTKTCEPKKNPNEINNNNIASPFLS